MTNLFKSFLLSFCLLIGGAIIIGSCNLLPVGPPTKWKTEFKGVGVFHVTARPQAGSYYIKDETLAHALDSFLQKLKINKDKIVTAQLHSLQFVIPDTSQVDFSSYYDCQLVLKGVSTNLGVLDSVALVFPDTTGRVNELTINDSEELNGPNNKTYNVTKILNSPNMSTIAYYRTKSKTPYTEIYMKYHFELSFSEEQ